MRPGLRAQGWQGGAGRAPSRPGRDPSPRRPESTHRPVLTLEHRDGSTQPQTSSLYRATPDTQRKRRQTDSVRCTTAASPKTGHRALILPQELEGWRDSRPHRSDPHTASRDVRGARETTCCGSRRELLPTLPRPTLRDRDPQQTGSPDTAWNTQAPGPRPRGPRAQTPGSALGGGGAGETWSPLWPRAPTFSRAIFFLPQPSHVKGNLGQIWWCACKGHGGRQGPGPACGGHPQARGRPVWMPGGQGRETQARVPPRRAHLHVGRGAGRPAVPAAEAPLRALVLQVVLLLAQAHEAFARRALGQHEWALSFVAALATEGVGVGGAVAGFWPRPGHRTPTLTPAPLLQGRDQDPGPASGAPPSGHRGDSEGGTEAEGQALRGRKTEESHPGPGDSQTEALPSPSWSRGHG